MRVLRAADRAHGPLTGASMALAVLVDGVPLAEEDARGVWQRFSAWMEEHPSDLAGFARAEGFASVHPELQVGEPVLVASRTAPQRPYGSAPYKGRPAVGGRAPRGRPGRRR